MTPTPETFLELDLEALAHNYRFLRSKLDSKTLFMGVVKAYAYGSDAVAMAKKLEILGADYLAVAYAAEGVALRDAGIRLPIMVLHPQPSTFAWIIERDLEPNLYSKRMLTLFLQISESKGLKNYPVHIKFNTGLNRIGFAQSDIDFIEEQLNGQTALQVRSIFSHLAASDDLAEDLFTQSQIKAFSKIVTDFEAKMGTVPIKHLLNTSGILNYPGAQWNMVRSGIGLHGYGNDPTIDAQLKPFATLKTMISQIQQIAPGTTVGYNRAFKAKTSRVTATLPLGHADGIGRIYGNEKGFVTIKGQQAPIVGNVCMDMLMVDVTGLDCKEGDQAIVFGKGASAEGLAKGARSISYELLTGISQRVNRSVIGI